MTLRTMQLDKEHARFEKLLSAAEERFAAGDLHAAAGLARITAELAFPRHLGLFASPRLEKLLLALGRRIQVVPASAKARDATPRRRVLHVLTHARPVGGDNRFVWRWIQNDGGSQHSIAVTAQSEIAHLFEVPARLKEAAEKSGGTLHILGTPSSQPLEQARELRRLCLGVDIVVLHLYPYDIVPVLALASECDSVRVALVNHSDHTFWVGGSVADLVIHFRRQSAEFLRERRGLRPEQSSVLPIPMIAPNAKSDQAEAKRALGYGTETVLLLTIAMPFKYSFPGRTGFLDLVTPVLEQCSNAVLLAVGPESSGAWQEASARTNGRIQALGVRWDNDVLYAAADIYLDSHPFSSITSILEAGLLGKPVLAGDSGSPDLMLLGPGTPGLDGVIWQAADIGIYQGMLERLIRDAKLRQCCGDQVREKILSLHAGDGWLKAVNGIYDKLAAATGNKCLVETEDVFKSGELDEAVRRLYAHTPPGNFRRQLQYYLGGLPYTARLSALRSLRKRGFDIHPLNLLPSSIYSFLSHLSRKSGIGP